MNPFNGIASGPRYMPQETLVQKSGHRSRTYAMSTMQPHKTIPQCLLVKHQVKTHVELQTAVCAHCVISRDQIFMP